MTQKIRRHAQLLGGVALSALMLAGCASTSPATPRGEQSAGASSPTAAVRVATPGAVTVLEAKDGPQLCLGMILTSYPPQCGGPAVQDWNWDDWAGSFEEASGVRWGTFHLEGTYSPEKSTFTPSRVEPRPEGDGGGDAPDAGDDPFRTPCAPPAGGWQVINPALTTTESMERTFTLAAGLPGYAGAWVDRSRITGANPNATPLEQLEQTAPQPLLTVINVRVTGDLKAAEEALRQSWGGMLCVSMAEHTEAELNAIAQEISASETTLSAGTDTMRGQVLVTVVYDDGTLQRHFDKQYGAGLVAVSSQLRPIG